MGRCGRFIRIVVKYFSLFKGANDNATAPAPYQQNNIIIKLPEYFL